MSNKQGLSKRRSEFHTSMKKVSDEVKGWGAEKQVRYTYRSASVSIAGKEGSSKMGSVAKKR